MAEKKLPVVVFDARLARGDVGPCAHGDCRERATYIVDFDVNSVEARTWVCDEHRDLLPAQNEAMATG